MATTVARLEAILSAQTRDFDRAMDRSQGKMHSVGRVAGIAGAAIAGGLAYGLEKSVKAALHAQTSQNRLEQSFKNAHIAIEPYTKAIERAESAGRKLGFTDEDTKTSLGSLITATGSYTKAAQDLAVAQDVARFKGVSLIDATKMLTMAQTGSQRAAKQLGITVPTISAAYDALGKNATAAEQAQARVTDKMATGDAVIQAVRQHVSGQAEAYSKTASGGMEQFRAQLDHLEVSMGTGLLPILAQVAAALARGTEFFSKHTTAAKTLTVALGALAAALLAAKIQQIALNLVVLANPYVAAATAIAALVVGLVILQQKYNAVTNAVKFLKEHLYLLIAVPIVGEFTAIALAIQPAIVAVHGISSAISHLVGWLRQAISLVQDLIGWLGKIHVPHIGIPFVGGGGGGGGGKALTSNDRHMLVNTVPQVKNAVEVARENGWSGSITSGFRTYAEQAALYRRYLAGGPLAAKPGTSSHERGEAVDVTSYGAFGGIMSRTTPAARLYNRLGGADPVHYSVSGYDKGGWLSPGVTMAVNTTGRAERVVSGNGDNVVIPISIGGEHVATVIFDQLRRKAKVFENRNGRPAFGGT